jgi:hypothetical protein
MKRKNTSSYGPAFFLTLGLWEIGFEKIEYFDKSECFSDVFLLKILKMGFFG